MIHASIGPCCSIAGSTISRTLPNTFSSDQDAIPIKCSNDWCCAAVRAGAVFKSKLDADGLGVFEAGLSVLLDHFMNRIRPDWHGDGLGGVRGHRCSGETASSDDAGAGGHGEESSPRRIYG